MLRWFSRCGLLDPHDARDILTRANGGFSLDASECIADRDRAGLEWLLRDRCALERIEEPSACSGEQQIIYHLPDP